MIDWRWSNSQDSDFEFRERSNTTSVLSHHCVCGRRGGFSCVHAAAVDARALDKRTSSTRNSKKLTTKMLVDSRKILILPGI